MHTYKTQHAYAYKTQNAEKTENKCKVIIIYTRICFGYKLYFFSKM